jgi:hypothetical protein
MISSLAAVQAEEAALADNSDKVLISDKIEVWVNVEIGKN